MTELEARRALEDGLGQLGIQRGDTVYLGVDMAHVPLPSYPAALDRAAILDREQRWCAFLYDVLHCAVGAEGTLLAPTFSYAYARLGTPYIHEETPSETGPFTEFLRTRPGTVRSFHPLNSIAGEGLNAPAILLDVGRAGYGPLSPFARLRAFAAKFLFLGAPLETSLTHAHHLEHMYGVNHMYHKLCTVPAVRDGHQDPGPWLCFVRYLGAGVEPCIGNLEARLRGLGALGEASGGTLMQCAGVEDVEDVGYVMLRENPCAFLREALEVHVDAPGAVEQQSRVRALRLSITETPA